MTDIKQIYTSHQSLVGTVTPSVIRTVPFSLGGYAPSGKWYSPNNFGCYSIQLTNWILWNGQFYYRDVIKMTITRAKGEGNGHFYHIEVIDLPFHTIPFVSCFISLIENTKNELLLKIYKQIWDNLRASKFTGQSIFSFAYYASFDAPLCAQPRAVRADNDNGRRLSSQDYASIARAQCWF